MEKPLKHLKEVKATEILITNGKVDTITLNHIDKIFSDLSEVNQCFLVSMELQQSKTIEIESIYTWGYTKDLDQYKLEKYSKRRIIYLDLLNMSLLIYTPQIKEEVRYKTSFSDSKEGDIDLSHFCEIHIPLESLQEMRVFYKTLIEY